MARTGHGGRSWRRWLVGAALLGVAGGAVLGWLYHRHVVANPGAHLERRNIMSVIAQESAVFYRDGRTRIGVFFEDEHRSYVGWDDLPRAYVAAIVAAEDDRFWGHPGFDPVHIVRAMRDNLRAGSLVAGGSTLTQQTAKNLYYRPDRSLRSKLIEALNALRLEAHYDKTEILTFYANQFHVSGNGRGLAIGARHFFDKDVDELGVLESAFLAGVVKAPSHYDPFLGGAERRGEAVEAAHARTTYVLRRLVEESPEALAGPWVRGGDAQAVRARMRREREVRAIQEEARRLLDEGFTLPFDRGTFRYPSSAVLDEVARRLAEPPFDAVLEASGVDDPATAGLQVITTLDAAAQRAAIYGLWHHLTEVGTVFEGHGLEAFVRPEDAAPRHDPDDEPEPWTFRTATVTGRVEVGGRGELELDLGGTPCRLDRDAIVRAAVAVERGRTGDPRSKVSTDKVDAVLDTWAPGTVLWVSVREIGDDGLARCDAEVRPELQGAAVALHDGEVLAMVGGNDNRNFNRATALRQLGSTWKTVVLHAALELGWAADAPIDNRRAVFPFSTTFYWPSPDHQGPETVGLAWAGVESENLAIIWLLYHLIDVLTPEAVAELAQGVGLARGADESEEAYRLRIQREGVLPTRSRVREGWYLQARQEVVRALGDQPEALRLWSLPYGWGFAAEARRASAVQRAILDRTWLAVDEDRVGCRDAWTSARAMLELGVVPPAGAWPELSFRWDGRGLEVACGATPEGFGPLPEQVLALPVALPGADDIRLDVGITVGIADAVASAMARIELAREVAEDAAPGLYDPEVLYWHQDFRVLLGVKYVASMAAELGVRTGIREVLSLPLGASEVTLEEAAMLYEGLIRGETVHFPGRALGPGGRTEVDPPAAATLLIAELRDVDGRVLYRTTPEVEDVTSPQTGALTRDLLGHVVTHGTGRRAAGAVEVAGADLPLGGKTGTTNDFRNAAFLGYAPVVEDDALADAIVVGVYVGYDDNRPMSRARIRLAGASGALPAWITTVRGLGASGLLGPPESRAPDDGWAWTPPAGIRARSVDPATGLPSDDPDATQLWVREVPVVAAPVAELGGWSAPRPVRIAPRTTDPPPIPEAVERPGGVWRRRVPDGGSAE